MFSWPFDDAAFSGWPCLSIETDAQFPPACPGHPWNLNDGVINYYSLRRWEFSEGQRDRPNVSGAYIGLCWDCLRVLQLNSCSLNAFLVLIEAGTPYSRPSCTHSQLTHHGRVSTKKNPPSWFSVLVLMYAAKSSWQRSSNEDRRRDNNSLKNGIRSERESELMSPRPHGIQAQGLWASL